MAAVQFGKQNRVVWTLLLLCMCQIASLTASVWREVIKRCERISLHSLPLIRLNGKEMTL